MFLCNQLSWLDLDGCTVVEVIVEFLIEKFGGFSHAKIVEHCSTGMLWQLVEKINDEAIRDYCNDALDPHLRFECLMHMALCETDLMPHLKWCEADVAEDWDGGAWYELQQKIESTIEDLTRLTVRSTTGNKARMKHFDAAFAFSKSDLKGKSDWCHTRTRGAVNLVLYHMKKSTGFILQNPVLQLATVMHPNPEHSRAAAAKFACRCSKGLGFCVWCSNGAGSRFCYSTSVASPLSILIVSLWIGLGFCVCCSNGAGSRLCYSTSAASSLRILIVSLWISLGFCVCCSNGARLSLCA